MKTDELIYRAATKTVDSGTTVHLDAVNDEQVVDIRDLKNASLILNRLTGTGAGTFSVSVDLSYDGVNWQNGYAVITQADLPTGNDNSAHAVTLSDARGMPIRAKLARFRMTAYVASATPDTFDGGACGGQCDGFAG